MTGGQEGCDKMACDKRWRLQRTRGSGITRGGKTIDSQAEKERVTMRGNNMTRGRCSSRDEKAANSDVDWSKTRRKVTNVWQDFFLCL